jgi:hypothetical protein
MIGSLAVTAAEQLPPVHAMIMMLLIQTQPEARALSLRAEPKLEVPAIKHHGRAGDTSLSIISMLPPPLRLAVSVQSLGLPSHLLSFIFIVLVQTMIFLHLIKVDIVVMV